MKAGKYIIEIKELDECPSDWTKAGSWPSKGTYIVKTEYWSVYFVGERSVNYAERSTFELLKEYIESDEKNISEDLFLKALAATSRAEHLK